MAVKDTASGDIFLNNLLYSLAHVSFPSAAQAIVTDQAKGGALTYAPERVLAYPQWNAFSRAPCGAGFLRRPLI
jgi:hypothetical protein